MDDKTWTSILSDVFTHPDKIALGFVIIVGAWSWIKQLIREARGTAQEETLIETLLRENRELREELRNRREHDE